MEYWVAQKASRNKGGCIKGAEWRAMRDKIAPAGKEIRSDWCGRKNNGAG